MWLMYLVYTVYLYMCMCVCVYMQVHNLNHVVALLLVCMLYFVHFNIFKNLNLDIQYAV